MSEVMNVGVMNVGQSYLANLLFLFEEKKAPLSDLRDSSSIVLFQQHKNS